MNIFYKDSFTHSNLKTDMKGNRVHNITEKNCLFHLLTNLQTIGYNFAGFKNFPILI